MQIIYSKIIFLAAFVMISPSLISQTFINQPHYFVGVDEMHIYKQSNDTLFHLTSFSVNPDSLKEYKRHYKIWAIDLLGENFYALKLERLDTIQMTTEPYPEDRYYIFIYKTNNEGIDFLEQISGLTQSDLQNAQLIKSDYTNNFAFRYYSLHRMYELLKLKRVKTIDDVNRLGKELDDPSYITIVQEYEKARKMPDTYASGLMATIFNSACLKLGYSPVGASVIMIILTSENYDEEKRLKLVNEYYERINPE